MGDENHEIGLHKKKKKKIISDKIFDLCLKKYFNSYSLQDRIV